ncbi:hypothetical protein Cpir12675_002517 [Ceratocystis pirilliformis]|uniref:DUF6590 domain-containing protein n=1 Tax=Ceratocystis pirilliformis TaxID=259994 RepID=A0ABR3Z9R2_9PEZI
MEWSEFGSWIWSPEFQRYYRQRQNQYHFASSATTTLDSGSDSELDNPSLASANENGSYTTYSPNSSYHDDLDIASVPASSAAVVATSYKVNSHGVHVQGEVASDGGPLVRQGSCFAFNLRTVRLVTTCHKSTNTTIDSVPEVDIYDGSAYNADSQYNVDPKVLHPAMESLQISRHTRVSTSIPHDRPSQISQEDTSLVDFNEVLDPRKLTVSGTPHQNHLSNMDPGYQVHKSTNFQPGEVFKVLWSEPVGKSVSTSSSTVSGTQTFVDSYGERFYVGFRRFIVVANDAGHCTCVPILTYGGRGCQKSGVKPDRHGIVVQCGKKAKPAAGEPTLGFPPIRVQIRAHGERLTRESRINYSKLVTVEHNVKVFFVGSILTEDADLLQDAVNQCWERKSFHRRPYTRVY